MCTRFVSVIGLAIAAVPAALTDAGIPAHPDEIAFPPFQYDPPDAQEYRHRLDTAAGPVFVYLAPSHEFPLINLVFTFKGGSFLDPPDQVGLVRATAAMMRRGGTASVSAEALDEELDFLAANVSSSARDTRCTASLNSLASNFDESFALFMDMVRNPGFQANRLELYKEERLESMKQRNDQTTSRPPRRRRRRSHRSRPMTCGRSTSRYSIRATSSSRSPVTSSPRRCCTGWRRLWTAGRRGVRRATRRRRRRR
jgi:hypothetical protein